MATANTISDNGQIIAGAAGPRGFRFESESEFVNGAFTHQCSVLGMHADGQTLVGYSLLNGRTIATWWNGVDPYVLPTPPGFGSSAWTRAIDISDDRSVIIGQVSVGSDIRAVVWRNGVPQLLGDLLAADGADLTGWRISHVSAISADGRLIVGEAFNPNGKLQAYVATIPAPGGLVVLGGGVCLCVRRRR
ncbi:MAG: hypothetical protein KF869_09120 [Phycisphaeraceae bacterium]|nr:hypothetical protein [Phycisphaeraceae bacterium]